MLNAKFLIAHSHALGQESHHPSDDGDGRLFTCDSLSAVTPQEHLENSLGIFLRKPERMEIMMYPSVNRDRKANPISRGKSRS